jgi:hypothetical protein
VFIAAVLALLYFVGLVENVGGEHAAPCRNDRVLIAPCNAFKL